jgi:hypothetical protein
MQILDFGPPVCKLSKSFLFISYLPWVFSCSKAKLTNIITYYYQSADGGSFAVPGRNHGKARRRFSRTSSPGPLGAQGLGAGLADPEAYS